jgi:cytochrome P450
MRYLLLLKQTVSAMTTLFYVMAMNPHVLKKAQEELERIIGMDRLPTMSDLDQLHYINAVIKEVLRWNPPVPLGAYAQLLPECSPL